MNITSKIHTFMSKLIKSIDHGAPAMPDQPFSPAPPALRASVPTFRPSPVQQAQGFASGRHLGTYVLVCVRDCFLNYFQVTTSRLLLYNRLKYVKKNQLTDAVAAFLSWFCRKNNQNRLTDPATTFLIWFGATSRQSTVTGSRMQSLHF